jgi:hypothetical protein
MQKTDEQIYLEKIIESYIKPLKDEIDNLKLELKEIKLSKSITPTDISNTDIEAWWMSLEIHEQVDLKNEHYPSDSYKGTTITIKEMEEIYMKVNYYKKK